MGFLENGFSRNGFSGNGFSENGFAGILVTISCDNGYHIMAIGYHIMTYWVPYHAILVTIAWHIGYHSMAILITISSHIDYHIMAYWLPYHGILITIFQKNELRGHPIAQMRWNFKADLMDIVPISKKPQTKNLENPKTIKNWLIDKFPIYLLLASVI